MTLYLGVLRGDAFDDLIWTFVQLDGISFLKVQNTRISPLVRDLPGGNLRETAQTQLLLYPVWTLGLKPRYSSIQNTSWWLFKEITFHVFLVINKNEDFAELRR